MSNEELDQNSPHQQYRPAQTPLATQTVRQDDVPGRTPMRLTIAAATAMGAVCATVLAIVLFADVSLETKLIVAVIPFSAFIALAFFAARMGVVEDRIVDRLRQPPDRDDIRDSGVVPFLSPETLGAARRLSRKLISQEHLRDR